jgi:hypothetical protein
MAGEWVKIDTTITTRAEVIRMASALKRKLSEIVGYCAVFWCAATEQGIDGALPGWDEATVDDLIGCKGFAAAMRSVGWLGDLTDGRSGLQVPKWQVHNAPSAKRRALDRERKRKTFRSEAETFRSDADTPISLSLSESQEGLGGAGGKGVKPKPTPPEIPLMLDTPEFRDAWADWQTARKEQGRKALGPTGAKQQLNKLAAIGSDRAIAAIRHSIANGWQGIFEEKTNGSGINGVHSGSGRVSAWDRRAAAAAREFPEDIKLPIA